MSLIPRFEKGMRYVSRGKTGCSNRRGFPKSYRPYVILVLSFFGFFGGGCFGGFIFAVVHPISKL